MKGVYILLYIAEDAKECIEGVYCDRFIADRALFKLKSKGLSALRIQYKRIRWSD